MELNEYRKYALIEPNSGFVWWVGTAASPELACAAATLDTGHVEREYEAAHALGGGVDGYYVFAAPDGFTVDNGQDQAQINAVSALPLVGKYRAITPDDDDDDAGVFPSRMSTHTPIPWQYAINGTEAIIVTPDDDVIFHVSVLQHSTQLSDLEGNLSLLTRAVNQHALLLGALIEARAALDQMGCELGIMPELDAIIEEAQGIKAEDDEPDEPDQGATT